MGNNDLFVNKWVDLDCVDFFYLTCLGQDDDDTSTVQSQPLPKDAFKIRQLRKARVAAGSVQTGAASYGSVQTGSASYGSGFSGEQSGSYG